MGVIWTPQEQKKQPTAVNRVNRGNPITQGLQFCYSLASKNNEVTNKTIGIVTAESGRKPTNTKFGPAIGAFAGTGLAYETISSVSLGSSYTLLSFQLGDTGNYQCIIDDDNGVTRAFQYRISNTNGFDFIPFTTGGSPVAVSSATLTTKQLTSGFVAVASVTSAGDISLWIDGVRSTGSLGGTPQSPAASLAVLNRKTGGTQFPTTQPVLLTAGWNRVLSEAEVQALCQNPWQLFAAPVSPKFFPVVAGGGTVTGAGSSAGVGTVSGVGASTSAQVGSSAGVGTASGVGASTANSVGSSTGTGTASGVGSSTGGSDGVGSSTGTGIATGVGASTAASLGSTASVGTASGIGASTAASTGAASGTGTASGVGTNGSVVSTGVGSASGTGTATGISPTVSRGGGKTTGKNLSRKQKKKLKAVESQEWLKAEETARQLLSDRFTKQTPQEKAQALETYIESLQPVIEALKALTSQIEEVVEEAPVIELTPHQEVIQRFDRLEKKVKSVEELIIILMADL